MAVSTDRQNRAQRRIKEREDARFQQAERDSETLVATSTAQATTVDGQGVERIVTILPPDYTPPQVEPDPREVERLKKLESRLSEEKEARLKALSGTSDEGAETAKKAFSAEGGSSSTTEKRSTKPATS